MKTRTGGFEIGFRRGWSVWQKDIPSWTKWAKENNFNVLDIGNDADLIASEVTSTGIKIGSADLKGWQGIASADSGKRKDALNQNREYIEACSKLGIKNYFAVMIPEDAAKDRADNFKLMVAGLEELATTLDAHDSYLVIEGWPGAGALACTPEGYRSLFNAVPSKSMAVNFDPSHLIRMGIDAVRFLEEFAPRVKHVHGKDTELLPEGLYEYGTEQPPTFGKSRGFGAMHWRYTIPGHGCFRWTKGLEILRDAGYNGAVCIELEDEYFNTDGDTEKEGLIAAGAFLASA